MPEPVRLPMDMKAIAQEFSNRLGLPEKTSWILVRTFRNILADAIQDGRPIALPGFGLVDLTPVPAREARNPRTGEVVQVPATFRATYRPSRKVRLALRAKASGESLEEPVEDTDDIDEEEEEL